MAFHEVRFPVGISLASAGGPERRTDIVTLASGFEERNARWADSRRTYDAGYGIKSLNDLFAIIDFFEERRGRLYGFRWKDYSDWKSCPPENSPASSDQTLGIGDGVRVGFQLIKTYGGVWAPYVREITKPVAGTVLVEVGGLLRIEGVHYTVDYTSGLITFAVAPAPGAGGQGGL